MSAILRSTNGGVDSNLQFDAGGSDAPADAVPAFVPYDTCAAPLDVSSLLKSENSDGQP